MNIVPLLLTTNALGGGNGLPPLPAGYAFVVDDNGDYVVDDNGDYVIALES